MAELAGSTPAGLGPAVIVLFFTYTLYRFYYLLGGKQMPDSIQWVGGNSWLSRVKSSLADMSNGRKHLSEGYEKYTKLGRPYVLPRLTFDPYVILPPTLLPWLSVQPGDVLDAKEPQYSLFSMQEIQHAKVLGSDIETEHLQETTVRKDMTKKLPSMMPYVVEELQQTVKEYWGTDTENYKEVDLHHDIHNIVTRTTNRLFVGRPLCQDDEFNKLTEEYASAMFSCGTALAIFCPRVLKPLVAAILPLSTKRLGNQYAAKLRPLIEQRVKDLRKRQAESNEAKDGDNNGDEQEPNDFLQWLIHSAAECGKADVELDPDRLITRLQFMTFAAIHTSSASATNVLLDLSSGDAASVNATWATLRAEAEDAFVAEGGQWGRSLLERLVKTDSAVRESMRLNVLINVTMERKVVARDGIVLPTGERLPYGTPVAMSTWQQHDPAFFDKPDEYQPFRFVDDNNDNTDHAAPVKADGAIDDGKVTPVPKVRNQRITTAGRLFMNFGGGKHTCPGRFFAAQEMKTLVSYVALNYDIEPLPERPTNVWTSTSNSPAEHLKLRVRRRN